jgi:hypothetical protein
MKAVYLAKYFPICILSLDLLGHFLSRLGSVGLVSFMREILFHKPLENDQLEVPR